MVQQQNNKAGLKQQINLKKQHLQLLQSHMSSASDLLVQYNSPTDPFMKEEEKVASTEIKHLELTLKHIEAHGVDKIHH